MFVYSSQCTLNVVRLPGSLTSFWCMEGLGPQHFVFTQRDCVPRQQFIDGVACQYFPLKVFMRTWVRLNGLSDGHIWLITSSYKLRKITLQGHYSNHYLKSDGSIEVRTLRPGSSKIWDNWNSSFNHGLQLVWTEFYSSHKRRANLIAYSRVALNIVAKSRLRARLFMWWSLALFAHERN